MKSERPNGKSLDTIAIVISLFGLAISVFAFYNTYSFEFPQQRPYVTADEVRFDVSKALKEISGELVFQLKNTGKVPLRIESLEIHARPDVNVISPGERPAIYNPVAPVTSTHKTGAFSA